MGALADAALAASGKVVGVLPRFMYDLEWGHPRLTELRLVGDLHERKRLMIEEVDAIVALPGGSGTLEELMEAITWKRLGLHGHPLALVNGRGFFDPPVGDARRARWPSVAPPGLGEYYNAGWGDFFENCPQKKFWLGLIPLYGWPGYLQVLSAIDAYHGRTSDNLRPVNGRR